mgnify:CR=1 FL=1
MPLFKYTAKEGPHRVVSGTVESHHLDGAVSRIVQLGLTPIDVALEIRRPGDVGRKSVKPFLRLRGGIRLKSVVVFTRQMSDLAEAAVPILRALQVVSHQLKDSDFKGVVEGIDQLVTDGSSFSDALAHYPQVFPPFYVSMVRAAEASGQMEKILNRLADHMEKDQETRGKIKSSLAYPLLILMVGFGTVFVLLTFVIPRLSVMFDDLDQRMPLPTVILMNTSGFFMAYGWIVLGAAAGAGMYGRRWVNSEKGRLWFDVFKLRIPFLKDFITIVEVGHFARTLGTLLESGVTITSALNAVHPTMNNKVLQSEVQRISQAVSEGSTLKAAFERSAFFPEMVVNMVLVGEESGRLERGLYKVADVFERQTDEIVKTMLSLLGPLVLVVIVSIVGFAVIAMLLPIFQMNLLVQ